MDIKECESLETELKKNTEILENTFERLNLKVLSIAYSGNIEDTGLNLWVELVALNGSEIVLPNNCCGCYVDIKVNFYENKKLLCSDSESIFIDDFNGYDTIHIYMQYANILSRATSARIYATT